VIKEPPSLARVLAMAAFALTCFGLLIFLWLSFGGPIPLKPEQYRLTVDVPEAANLANEADVRMSGLTIGKVKSKQLDKGGVATKVTLDIDPKFAPIAKDAKFILRQKTLLGETYAEIAPGDPRKGYLPDGGAIPRAQVEKTVELDEIFSAFDKPTRTAFQKWVKQSALAIKGSKQNPDSTAQGLNDALGNLGPFASDASDVLGVLDRQKTDLSKLIRNTGVVFGAISERDNALRNLITNSDQVFTATNQRDKALRQIFEIFPTFLDESKATLARLQTFSNNARPLMVDLQPVARKLNPTVKDLADLSPNLRQLFRDLNPLITVSQKYLPDAERFLRGAPPVLSGLHAFLQELNPVLSYMNYDARSITAFLSNGAATANYRFKTDSGHVMHALSQFGVISGRSFAFGGSPEQEGGKIPSIERANAYPLPENYLTAGKYGGIQSFSCANAGGEQNQPTPKTATSAGAPPCHEQGKSAWDGNLFPRLDRGKAPNQKAPDDPGVSEAGQPKHYP
jgi:phospholipid/cholesterol/gamma-HCH transport system substrate-binding protein